MKLTVHWKPLNKIKPIGINAKRLGGLLWNSHLFALICNLSVQRVVNINNTDGLPFHNLTDPHIQGTTTG